MKIIRNQTFETNSSSSHSLVVQNAEGRFCTIENFPKVYTDENDKRFVLVPAYDSYEWDQETITESIENKISYILTNIGDTGKVDLKIDLFDNHYNNKLRKKLYKCLSDTLLIDYVIVYGDSGACTEYVEDILSEMNHHLDESEIWNFIFTNKYGIESVEL